MAELVLTATPAAPWGTRATRRLRREGKVPGVVYGLGADPVAVSRRLPRAASASSPPMPVSTP